MKKIKSFILAAMAFALAAPVFTACSSSDDNKNNETVENIISEFSVNDKKVAAQKAASKKNEAVLLIAFGSTWNNAFLAFDETIKAYEKAFPNADVYISFSSDICINRASVGENYDDNGNIVRRDYYEPRYLLHAIGAAKYSKIYVQSLQVIPGEEFAAVVASVKKFMNNGYIGDAHLDDAYLAKLAEDEAIFFGMPLLNDPDVDVPAVATELHKLYGAEAQNGVVAFMGHGNPDNYDTFKANVRYTQLETALKAKNLSLSGGDMALTGKLSATNIQCGYAMLTGGANVVRTKSVQFDTAFTTDPHVTATPYVQYPQNAHVSLSSITRTGFDINLYYASTTDVNVQWIAIGM